LGTVVSIKAKKKSSEIFFKFSSYLSPGTIFRVNLNDANAEPAVIRETQLNGFDASQFRCDRVFYPSKDGTEKIPMFIVYHKDVKKDGTNPAWLYIYGGFSYALQPYFSTIRLTWLQHYRGIYAVACVRGGGEYGEDWHQKGVKEKRQNVFNDVHSAAEYLIQEKFTTASKLVLNGASNGGLTVMACTNQRPDLYGVANANVGVLDMLRFHKFTIGHFWCSDYGNADNAEGEDARFLLAYSPIHNVKVHKDHPYPAIFLSTADHDDRVSPLHSFKMAAEIQHTLGKDPRQTAPLLIRIERKAGHGAGKPTDKIIAEYADGYAFISQHMNLKWHE
jgi:prolyl oligopeptidase